MGPGRRSRKQKGLFLQAFLRDCIAGNPLGNGVYQISPTVPFRLNFDIVDLQLTAIRMFNEVKMRRKTMFGMFRKSPLKKLEQEHGALLTEAFNAQRNGDIRQYSMLTAEAEALREKIENLKCELGE